MGSIINPISYRIGWSHYWSSSWALSHFTNSKYAFLINQDYNLIMYLNSVFKSCVHTYLIFSRLKIMRTNKSLFFILNYNSPWLEWILDELNFLNFSLRKLTEKQKRNNKKPRRIFKPWRPDLAMDAHRNLKKALRPLRISIGTFKLTVEQFRLLVVKSIKQFFINYILWGAVKIFKQALINYTKLPVHLIFVSWDLLNISAINLAKFMRDKFNTFSTLNQVLRSVAYITRQLLLNDSILGYKIMYKGRFKRLGRRGRATYSWEQKGALPLNTVNSNVSYASVRVRLKYSTCGLKVWLFHS